MAWGISLERNISKGTGVHESGLRHTCTDDRSHQRVIHCLLWYIYGR